MKKLLIGLSLLTITYVFGYIAYRESQKDSLGNLASLPLIESSSYLVIPESFLHNVAFLVWRPLIGADKEITGVKVIRMDAEKYDKLRQFDGTLDSEKLQKNLQDLF